MTHFSALNDYIADLPADRQQAINNKSKILSLPRYTKAIS